MAKYVLASQSPRRKQLLEWAELDFEILVLPTDESFPEHLSPAEAAIYISQQKARAVKQHYKEERPIIAADTIVVLDNNLIGKPANRQHAVEILTNLNGRTHQVITGVCIATTGETCFADTTEVEFHNITVKEIEWYVDKYKPYDKAGAYAIQEWIGVVGIKRVNGDFYNVMGLPVSRVVQVLKNLER
ncbi:MAG TPA: Maf family nucleotide pyrophosphatase [Chitinophagaceae bacterium]|nr:Maf family nucleotide pyrophosphatase [Chitinophagaceae bacterium]